ncbi:MAG: hypothetical protein HOQ24_08925 [Mycobacteriaceae bacterium]|nr:hypothetical protein [Mycobacteriaceae bacterium]
MGTHVSRVDLGAIAVEFGLDAIHRRIEALRAAGNHTAAWCIEQEYVDLLGGHAHAA